MFLTKSIICSIFLTIALLFSCKTTSEKSSVKTIDEVQLERNKSIILEIMITLIEKGLTKSGYSPQMILDVGVDREKLGKIQYDRDMYVRKNPGHLLLYDGLAGSVGTIASIFYEGAVRDLVDSRVFYWTDSQGNEQSAAFLFSKDKKLNTEGRLEIALSNIWINDKPKIKNYIKAAFYYERGSNQIEYYKSNEN